MELIIENLESDNNRLTKEINAYREWLKEDLADCERAISKRRMNVKIEIRRQTRKTLKVLRDEQASPR